MRTWLKTVAGKTLVTYGSIAVAIGSVGAAPASARDSRDRDMNWRRAATEADRGRLRESVLDVVELVPAD
jgi:hypothetical protein